jgi:hypothetical protein
MPEPRYELNLYVWDGCRERAKLSGRVSAEDYQAILAMVAAAIERKMQESGDE